MKAVYRKNNDGQMNSSKYHKKDGTNIREILKQETKKEVFLIISNEVKNESK